MLLPQEAIPLLESHDASSSPSFGGVVYIKIAGHMLLAVTPENLEIWSSSQHRVRLGRCIRNAASIESEGENQLAIWSSDTKTICVFTSLQYLHIYKVRLSGKKLLFGGKQSNGLSLVSISLAHSEKTPFSNGNRVTSNFACESKNIIFGLANGSLNLLSWKGEFSENFEVGDYPQQTSEDARDRTRSAIIQIDLSLPLRFLSILHADGNIALCTISKKGMKMAESIKVERWMTIDDAVCVSIASEQRVIAIGCRKGVVELYDLESASHLRTLSLYDWGYSMEDTGPVSCISWTPDNYAVAVGWRCRGLTVWSVSGCRLMCTIRQIGTSSISSPMLKHNHDLKCEPLLSGTSSVEWDEYGYRLYAIEESSCERILSFSFGKCCVGRGLSGATYIRQVIYGEDRILVVQSDESDDLKFLHLNLPVSYIAQNWPILHVVASKDGTYLAISGIRGLILYDLQSKKWRVFGDVTQEQRIACKGLLWLGKIVVVCNYVESSNSFELLFFPRYHLDQSSLLLRKPLLGKPMVMDVFEDYLLVTYRPFDIHIFHAKVFGELSPSSTPVLQLSTVRELSIMTAKSHPAAMRFIPDITSKDEISKKGSFQSSDFSLKQPSRCLILRSNGELSLLDLDDGHERALADFVELFWVTCGQSDERTNLIEEVSWIDYGCRGMQVWYPSPGADPFKQEDFLQLDPELEFDREVYPSGLLPNAGVIVGVSQRTSFSSCTEFPYFEPLPQAQTILHCLLRHLLQDCKFGARTRLNMRTGPSSHEQTYERALVRLRDKFKEALWLGHLSAQKPHFSHCLEWLLFTVFDAEISSQSSNKNRSSASEKPLKQTLLEKTCKLIQNFPEYLDVVVSVARKTDGRHWADLFSAAGRSTELFEDCFQRGWYRTAAGYILVIAKLEGPAVSQYCAMRLLQATLSESLYELAGELVRFLLRSGREYDAAMSDSDHSSPRFLGFLFTSSYRKQPFDGKSGSSFEETSRHITSVKNILESHAGYLMSEKELSKLVAFVKGTQFDLVEYLQRERLGSARLENFASGLELISQKLEMGSLQSRLDAEFLLAHMCSVKFKEWIVVLATLLRRVEVLFDLFRHDIRLWKAYKATLRSQTGFEEYWDLLGELGEQLASVSNSEEN